MSIRSFVTFSSVLLIAWLLMAFVHTPVTGRGLDPVGAEAEELSSNELPQPVDMTVSVSPSEVAPD